MAQTKHDDDLPKKIIIASIAFAVSLFAFGADNPTGTDSSLEAWLFRFVAFFFIFGLVYFPLWSVFTVDGKKWARERAKRKKEKRRARVRYYSDDPFSGEYQYTRATYAQDEDKGIGTGKDEDFLKNFRTMLKRPAAIYTTAGIMTLFYVILSFIMPDQYSWGFLLVLIGIFVHVVVSVAYQAESEKRDK